MIASLGFVNTSILKLQTAVFPDKSVTVYCCGVIPIGKLSPDVKPELSVCWILIVAQLSVANISE